MARWAADKRIVPFSMRVEIDKRYTQRGDPGEIFVGNFNGSGGDLLHYFSSFIEALPLEDLVERDTRHFGQPTAISRLGRTILWQMDGGESGRASSITLRRGGRKRKRDRSGVEWEPFWAMAVVPKDSNQGWLLVEKDGRYTLPTEWRKELVTQFSNTYPGFRLVISTVRDASLWNQVENSTEERLLRFEVSLRSADTTPASRGAEGYTRGMVEVQKRIFHPVGNPAAGQRLRVMRRAFTRDLTPEGLVEISLPLEVDDLSDDRVKIRLRDDVEEIKATVLNDDNIERTIVFEGLDAQQTFVIENSAGEDVAEEVFARECRIAVRDLASTGGVTLRPGWEATEWGHPQDGPSVRIPVDDNPVEESAD